MKATERNQRAENSPTVRLSDSQTVDRRTAVLATLAEAHGCCPSVSGSRDTGHGSQLRVPCCRNCEFAAPLQDGARQLLVCTRGSGSAAMRVTDPADRCNRFRAKRRRAARTMPPEPPDESVRHIPLTRGKYAVIDAADYERVAQLTWYASIAGNRVYARSSIDGRSIFLHRFLTNAPKGMVVDHIDHDGLNDRQGNLRICTFQQNLYNSRPYGKTSRFKGVCWDKAGRRWVVYIRHNGRSRFVGQFTDEVEAARAYDRAAVELFGEYAYLNFPAEAKACERRSVEA